MITLWILVTTWKDGSTVREHEFKTKVACQLEEKSKKRMKYQTFGCHQVVVRYGDLLAEATSYEDDE